MLDTVIEKFPPVKPLPTFIVPANEVIVSGYSKNKRQKIFKHCNSLFRCNCYSNNSESWMITLFPVF